MESKVLALHLTPVMPAGGRGDEDPQRQGGAGTIHPQPRDAQSAGPAVGERMEEGDVTPTSKPLLFAERLHNTAPDG